MPTILLAIAVAVAAAVEVAGEAPPELLERDPGVVGLALVDPVAVRVVVVCLRLRCCRGLVQGQKLVAHLLE